MFGSNFKLSSAIIRVFGGDGFISGVATGTGWTAGQALPTVQAAAVKWPRHCGVVRDTGNNEGNLKLATNVQALLLEEDVVDVLTAEALNYQVDAYKPAILVNETGSARAVLEAEYESNSPVLVTGGANDIGAADALGTAVRWVAGQLEKNSGGNIACGTIVRYTPALQGGTFRVVIKFNPA